MPVDYASQAYWETRLAKERETGHEWLVPTSTILPVVAALIPDDRIVKILHFGCGSSSLGPELQKAFGSRVDITDADYAASSIRPSSIESFDSVPLIEVDVLDLAALRASSPVGGWDILIDKSTADAISCGPPSRLFDDAIEKEAIDVLCTNVAQVTRPGGRWISISYSSERFNWLSRRPDSVWRVISRLPVKLQSSTVSNSQGVVYQPEEGVWAWILERA
jgi:hypothetical protein